MGLMNKKISIGAALAMMIIVIALTVSVTMLIAMRQFNSMVNELNKRQAMYSYLSEVDNAVRQNSYQTIDEEVLRQALAEGYINGIGDPYAAFLTAEEYGRVQQEMAGKSSGFGLEIARDLDGNVVISNVQKGAAAYSAGLKKGDRVTALDKEPLNAESLSAAREKLGTAPSIILTISRDGKETAVELSAGSYSTVSVDEHMVNEKVGYIRIRTFTDTTADQFKSAYNALLEQGAEAFVFDLRNNTGGSLEAAKSIIAYLLPRGPYAYYQTASGKTELRSEESYQMDKPSVTLINARTTGEAELMAGALKQSGLTTLVGGKTYGRGLVQNHFTITSDNAAVRLSVAELKLVDDTSWEGNGLLPDEVSVLSAAQEQAFDTLTDEQDNQLQTALAKLSQTSTETTPSNADTTTTVGTDETTEASETETGVSDETTDTVTTTTDAD